MTIVLIDNFTRGGGESSPYPVTSHTPVAGGSWTGAAQNILSPDGFCRGTGESTFRLSFLTSAVGADDYEVGGVIRWSGSGGTFPMAAYFLRGATSAATAGVQIGLWDAGGFGLKIQTYNAGPVSLLARRDFTPTAGRDYYVIGTVNGTAVSAACRDESTGLWLTSGGTFSSATRVDVISGTLASSTGQYTGIATYDAGLSDTVGPKFSSYYRAAVSELPLGLASFTVSPSTIPASHAGNISLSLVGSGTSWSAETFTISGVSGTAKVSQTITDTTHATVVVTTSSSTGTLTVSDGTLSSTTTVATPAVAVATPASLSTASTTTVSLTGTNTLWLSETAAGLFSVSGVAGCAISGTPSVSSNTAASISVVTGATAGTLTITDNSTGKTTSIAVASGPLTVAITDSSVFFSPYNWYSNGAGAMAANNIRASSTSALTSQPGAYIKVGVTVASSGTGYVNVGTPSDATIRYCVDSGAWTTGTVSAGQISLGVLSAATHTITVLVQDVGTTDRWNTPTNGIQVTGFQFPAGSTMTSPTLSAGRAVIYGDSITEGWGLTTHARGGYSWFLGNAMQCEFGIVAHGAQGWSNAGIGNVPAFSGAWDDYDASHSRLISGLLSPAPDVIICNHGKNTTFLTSTVNTWLTAARTAAPSAVILLVTTFDGTNRTSLIAASLPDSNCHVVDMQSVLADASSRWLQGDGIHPNDEGNANLAAMVADRVRQQRGGSASSFGTFGGDRL